jgi:dihydropteroate synthase
MLEEGVVVVDVGGEEEEGGGARVERVVVKVRRVVVARAPRERRALEDVAVRRTVWRRSIVACAVKLAGAD